MRMSCDVQVNNRQLPSLNMAGKARTIRSSLGIGKLSKSVSDTTNYVIHWCTAQNKPGTMYKIRQNVECIFSRFVNEGKFTIRLKEPTVDICVKAEPTIARGFLNSLKSVMNSKEDIDNLPLSSLAPAKQSQVTKPKTKLEITSKAEYPLTSNFPYKLEMLSISKIELTRIEKRILNLKKLRVLILNNNSIATIPVELSAMKSITELHLVNNNIDVIHHELFSNTNIIHNLRLLNLSKNKIKLLPHSISNLINLVTLNLSGNSLTNLPLTLGNLASLRYLSISENKLGDLPWSISGLRFAHLEVFGNPLSEEKGIIKDNITGIVPSLLQLAASASIPYISEETTSRDLPYTLLKYLRLRQQCLCGQYCFEHRILARDKFDLSSITASHTFDRPNSSSQVPVIAAFCTRHCYRKYTAQCFCIRLPFANDID